MNRITLAISSITALSMSLFPTLALAHQHETYRIGDKTYEFTIGSLNEPVTVDDKSGVDFSVAMPTEHAEDPTHVEGDSHAAATPVLGLEQTLKVELQAAGKTKELPLTTQYGKPGSYKAVFFPTVATTLTYRIFGTIEGKNVDLSFTCNPAGHPATPEDTTEIPMGDGVVRIKKTGAFGCPSPKEDLGFPEPSVALVDTGSSSNGLGSAALGLSAAALAIAAGSLAQSRKKQ